MSTSPQATKTGPTLRQDYLGPVGTPRPPMGAPRTSALSSRLPQDSPRAPLAAPAAAPAAPAGVQAPLVARGGAANDLRSRDPPALRHYGGKARPKQKHR